MSTTINLETVVSRRNDLMTSELSDTELVMLNIERGYYYGMADSAKAIWSQLDEPHAISEIVSGLMTKYAVDRETCETEVLAFVQDMLKDNLVMLVSG